MGPGSGSGLNPSEVFAGSDTGLELRDGSGTANQTRGVLKNVLFDFDSAAIRVAERAKVTEAADYLKANAGSRLLLEGHCDWRGTTEYNMGLGDRRAAAVRDYLGTLGVPAARLETLSRGDLDAKEGGNEGDMQQDRRVELVILK